MTIPATWQRAPIADFASLVSTGPFGSVLHKSDYVENGVPIVNPINIICGHIHPDPKKLIADSTRKRLASYTLKPGDVVVARRGEMGRCAVVQPEQAGWVCGTGSFYIRPLPTLEPDFLALLLRSPGYREKLESLARGATMKNLSNSALAGLVIAAPPQPEQRRIVARIDALFTRIRRARADLRRIAPLSRHFRDQLLVNAFHSGPSATVAELAQAVFDGPFGSNLKSNDYTSEGTRVVRLENIGHLHFDDSKRTFVSEQKASSLQRHRLKQDDVLFSSFIDKEVRVCLFPGKITAISKADCFCLRIDPERADPEYVALRLGSPTTYEDMREAVHGATRPRIGISDLKKYEINAPPVADQCAVVARLKRQRTMSDEVEAEAKLALALLDRLERSILARAFRGELFPQDGLELNEAQSVSSTARSRTARQPAVNEPV